MLPRVFRSIRFCMSCAVMILFACLIVSPEWASADTATGPRSGEEAELLWKNGRESFEKGNYADSARDLQRFIDRYPGKPGYLDAHFLLGESLVKIGKPDRALAPLRYFTQASRSPDDAAKARVLLARAYTDSGKHKESYLATIEIEKKHGDSPLIRSEALLVRAKALSNMGQDASAAKTLDSAKVFTDPLRGEAAWLGLRLKARQCARFAAQKKLDEEQVRDQITRKGTCLNEALLDFRSAAEITGKIPAENDEWGEKSLREMMNAFDDYWKSCSNPPAPPEPPPGSKKPRTPAQLKLYRDELTGFLQGICRKQLQEQSNLLSGWKDQPGSGLLVRLHAHLGELSTTGLGKQ